MRTQALFLYLQALHEIGKQLEAASSKWHRHCDTCLIATWSEGVLNCPLCDRPLLYAWKGDWPIQTERIRIDLTFAILISRNVLPSPQVFRFCF